MKDVALWSLWYGILVTLPLATTRQLIKTAMARTVTRRRMFLSMKRR